MASRVALIKTLGDATSQPLPSKSPPRIQVILPFLLLTLCVCRRRDRISADQAAGDDLWQVRF